MLELAERLRNLQVPCFPCRVWYDGSKKKWEKAPRIPKGEHWGLSALRPLGDCNLDWSSQVIGVPVPTGIVILDLDAYKGASCAAIDALVGCPLPWDEALIQTTISGGAHYAFRCSEAVRQGDNIGGVLGFDTRVGGKGFICSGAGYSPVVHGGVLAFGNPECLPELPPAAVEVLAPRKTEKVTSPTRPKGPLDVSNIEHALKHIDPGGSRDQWRNVGYALKALFHEHDDSQGQDLFERWSSGALWPGGTPANYVPTGRGSTEDQWGTFNAEGGVGPSTLYYYAIQGGWQAPSDLDVEQAFGKQAAPADVFNDLVEKIRTGGADIKATDALVSDIKSSGCNALQNALLAAELKSELKLAGLKDKAVAAHIDNLLNSTLPSELIDRAPPGRYGKNDSDNAVIFLDKHFPDNTLARCDGVFYAYNGTAWESLTSDTLKHKIAVDMAAQRMQDSKIAACYRMVSNLASVKDGKLNEGMDDVILFKNGVLSLDTGQLTPHDASLFTTNVMPYRWDRQARAPKWESFLQDVFSGDRERIDLLQEWFGYLMTKRYDHQKIMFFLGGPRCGKGTLGRVLSHLVGPLNFSGGSLTRLAADSYIDGISEKTVVFVGDAEKKIAPHNVNQVIERLKAISGNDEISWHRMYHGNLSRTLPSRFTIAANGIPALFDDSGALASRLLLLTFDKSYLGNEDLSLTDRLLQEIEGIAVWSLEGLLRLNSRGKFTQPAASLDEQQILEESYSPVRRFIEDCCELNAGECVTTKDLYDAYRTWTLIEHEDPMRPKTLTAAVRDAYRGRSVKYGIKWEDGKTIRAFVGLKLKAEGIPDAFTNSVVKFTG